MLNKALLIFFSFALSSSWAQRDSVLIHEDFNKDGIQDTLLKFYDGGTGFGGNFVELTNGKSGQTFKMDIYSCFCDLVSFYPIPDVLFLRENEYFFKAMSKHLLDETPFKLNPDPSLEWMLEAGKNRVELTNETIFSRVFHPQTEWVETPKYRPETYFIPAKTVEIPLFLRENHDLQEQTEQGFLFYNAHNHFDGTQSDLTVVAKNDTYTIYKSKHGILAEKESVYKWLFLSESNTIGSPEKLRWPSIETVILDDRYIFVEQSRSPGLVHFYFAIDIETGVVGELKPPKNFDIKKIEIQNDMLSLETGGPVSSYKVETLFYHLNELVTR